MSDTYLFDGVDIGTVARIASYEGLYDPPDLRGDDLEIPLNHGVEAVDRPFGVGSLTLQLVLLSGSATIRNDVIRAVTQLIKPGRVVTGTRRRAYTSGSEDHTAPIRYLSGLGPTFVGVEASLMAIDFTVLSGLWSGEAVAETPGTFDVAGDAPTRKILLSLPSAGTLTNTTNGVAVTVTAAADLNVTAHTTDGLLSDVVASGDSFFAWMRLEPGSNTVTWSGTGTPDITYQPVYA